MPVVNERGERLVSVLEGSAGELEAGVSMVLAHHNSGIVLVRNAYRSVWELPGGFIDPGECAADCALRELREESGLTGSDTVLLGYLEIERPAGSGDLLVCALYSCRADGIPLVSSRETTAVDFWRPGCDISPISALDLAMVERGLQGCAQAP
jgi:ADP-ribose pyrophosphatase YjhB (NUDIX family)